MSASFLPPRRQVWQTLNGKANPGPLLYSWQPHRFFSSTSRASTSSTEVDRRRQCSLQSYCPASRNTTCRHVGGTVLRMQKDFFPFFLLRNTNCIHVHKWLFFFLLPKRLTSLYPKWITIIIQRECPPSFSWAYLRSTMPLSKVSSSFQERKGELFSCRTLASSSSSSSFRGMPYNAKQKQEGTLVYLWMPFRIQCCYAILQWY